VWKIDQCVQGALLRPDDRSNWTRFASSIIEWITAAAGAGALARTAEAIDRVTAWWP
jgi:hypothetical protein